MQYTEAQVSQAMESLPTLWTLKHSIKNEAGLPIEFSSHKFLYDIYNDLSPLQVLLKPPQIGATVMNIIKSFWVANKLHKDIIYTLPTATDVNDMAGGKINRLVAQNPILQKWVKDKDTVEQKAVENNIIYYRGTFSAKQAMMVSSDLNIHDEVDSSDASVVTQYETRLAAKANGWRWYFSHPSLAGHGVDIYWQQSDKKEWYITCPCGAEQILTFPESIRDNNYICKECGAILEDSVRINGVWKPTAEGDFSGYHLSQMMCPWISAEAIIDAKNDPKKDEQYFYNYVLGLPYVASENKIDPSIVLKNVVPEINSQEGRIVIGVDTGLPIYYTIMNKQGVFYYGACKPPSASYDPYQELEGFLNRWSNSILVSDQGGDLVGIRRLQAKYPGRVFLCYYRRDRKDMEMIKWGAKDEFGKVTVDRNRMIQLIVEQMRDTGKIRLHGQPQDWAEFAEHFGNIYRTIKEDTHYGIEFLWERNGPDHYVHSLVYALTGMDRYMEETAIIVGGEFYGNLPVGRMFE